MKNGFGYDMATKTAYYELRDGGRRGRRVRKRVRGIEYRAARRLLHVFRQDLNEEPRSPLHQTPTLKEYLAAHPDRLGQHKPSTLERHETIQRLHLLPRLG